MPLFSWAGEFSMSVKIDGRDATVYQKKHHQEGDGRTRSEGWICSEVGKSYTIELDKEGYNARMNPHTRHKDISAHLRIDGVKTQGKAVRQPKKRCHFEGPIDRNKQCRPYIFQKPYHPQYKPYTHREVANLTSALSEKHKKGLLTCVTQYGPPVPVNEDRMRRQRKSTQDEEGSPYCKMTIRYASKEVLQAMDIIPRDPRPPTPPAELPTSTPTPPAEAIDAKPLISRSSSPQVDVEATATLDRLRRAREELELKGKAWKKAREEMEEAERSLRPGTSANASIKRKRGDENEEKSVLRRKLQGEMTEALRGYDGKAIDLTLDNMDEAGTTKLLGETIDLTDD